MPAWPKSIFTLGVSILSARTRRRLRRKNTAIPAQQRIFRSLTQQFAGTSFWKPTGIEPAMNYTQFRARVAPRKYESFAPAIAKMIQGQANVLWPGQCARYAISSPQPDNGKPAVPKYLPITDAMQGHFRRATAESLLYYTLRGGSAGVCRGRHLFLGGSTRVVALGKDNGHDFKPFASEFGGIMARALPALVEKYLCEPGREIAELPEWDARLVALSAKQKTLDLSLVAGIPSWILRWAKSLSEKSGGRPAAPLSDLWPKLACCLHRGEPIGPFAQELRQVLGAQVNFHEIYPAPEAFVGAQEGEARAGLRLLAEAGVFYEFMPVEDFDEARLPQLGEKALPLEGVRVGVDYVLLVTTPAGFCRYPMGDVVRFVSAEPPRFQIIGQTKNALTSFGERVSEKDVSDALLTICERNGWTIANFHVAPLFASPLYGTARGRHEWWVELKPGTVITPTGPQMALELDAELQRTNRSYEAKRKGTAFEAPIVRLVMPGVFERWLRNAGKWDAWHKIPRCHNHREIADPLADIAQFAHD